KAQVTWRWKRSFCRSKASKSRQPRRVRTLSHEPNHLRSRPARDADRSGAHRRRLLRRSRAPSRARAARAAAEREARLAARSRLARWSGGARLRRASRRSDPDRELRRLPVVVRRWAFGERGRDRLPRTGGAGILRAERQALLRRADRRSDRRDVESRRHRLAALVVRFERAGSTELARHRAPVGIAGRVVPPAARSAAAARGGSP